MSRIIYFPLEHVDSRYTTHLDRDIVKYFQDFGIDYLRIYPDLKSPGLKPGMFLDANFTIKFKSMQLAQLSDLYQNNEITNDDILFFSDLWFPGIESISYLNHFNNVFPEIRGIIHAGSFTDTDEVRKLERWAKNFEDIVFDISSKIFLGSRFIKNDILQKRFCQYEKLKVTSLPLDYELLNEFRESTNKENIIVFNSRNHPEKQPHLFQKTKELLKNSGWEIIWTSELNLNKNEYYKLLSRSKIVISFALQENFGYGIQEAVYLNNIPILPNRLAYKEQFHEKYLYNDFDHFIEMLQYCMNSNILPETPIKLNNNNIFNEWFKPNE